MTKLLSKLPYVHATELVSAWGITLNQLSTFAWEGQIEMCVMAIGVRIVAGYYEIAFDETSYPVAESCTTVSGPQPLYERDAWAILREGEKCITQFKADDNHFLDVENGGELKVSASDLLVMRSERERFEQLYDLGGPPQTTNAKSQSFTHSHDFMHLTTSGRTFHLGSKQATVVRLLFEATLSDNPWREGRTVLEQAGASSMRFVDLFKTQPHWRELIEADGGGFWRLKLPADAMRNRKTFRRPLLRLVS